MWRKIQSSLQYLSGRTARAWQRFAGGRGAVVLMYHRIDPPTTEPERHVPGLFGVERGVPVDVFEQQLRFMGRHFEARTATDLFGSASDRPAFAVTFDDGYADNLLLAAPVLSRLGVPATIFLSTDFIETDRRFWWETLGGLFRETRVEALRIADARSSFLQPGQSGQRGTSACPPHLPLGTQAEREAAHWHVSEALMRTPDDEITGVLTDLGRLLDVAPRFEDRDWPLLTWEQARALPRHGFEIGAHGAGHVNLGLAAPEDARDEVVRSIRETSERLAAPVRAFAYPYGDPEHRSEAAIAAVREAGCAVAFTTDLGVATPDDDVHLLPRAGLTRGDALACAYQIDEAFRAAHLRHRIARSDA